MEEIFRTLVAFPTIAGERQAAHDLLDYVSDFVQARGLSVTRYEWNGYESLVATVKPGDKTPKVMLAAHADVVAADVSMFELRKEDGKYIGRGVLDMKFAIAAYLQVIDGIKDDIHNYDIGLMITADEELGGINGMSKLVDEGYLPQACILPDGGDNWQIQTASKGFIAYDISVVGTPAHGSRPWLGDNAITRLMDIYQKITKLFPEHQTPETNTLSLTTISGGMAMNQVPGLASMTIDTRLIDSQQYQAIAEAIHRICDENQAICVAISSGAPTSFDLQDPFIAPFARLVTETTGLPMEGYFAMGASDVRYLVPFGVPCISVYPTGSGLHGNDEWIGVAALEQFRAITRSYLDEVAKKAASVDGDGDIR